MVKTNPEKNTESKWKQNKILIASKKIGKEKKERESFWRNPLHNIKSINEKTMRERLLRKQQNNLSIYQPIPLLKNLVSKHLESQNIELANTYHKAQKRESKL